MHLLVGFQNHGHKHSHGICILLKNSIVNNPEVKIMRILNDIGDKALSRYAKSRIASAEAWDAVKINKKQRGAMAVEYGLVLAIVVALVIAAASAMEGPLNTFFTQAVEKITNWMGT